MAAATAAVMAGPRPRVWPGHFGGGHHGGGRAMHFRSVGRSSFVPPRSFAGRGGPGFGPVRNAAFGPRNMRSAMNSLSRGGVAQRPAAEQPGGPHADWRRPRRWRDGMAAPWAMDGGSTAAADMDGSARCSGRSPITTSTTMRSGATASASGTTATPTSTPGYLRPTATTISRAICRSVGRGAGSAGGGVLAQMCGNDSRAVAGLPVDQIADAVQPTEAQFAALSELGQASLAAAGRTSAPRVRRRSC